MSEKYYIQHDDGTLEETEPKESVKRHFALLVKSYTEVCRNCRMWVRAHKMSGICTLYGDVMEEYGTCDEWEERKGEE